ncbi:MAG: D-alanyl-D-alanine carboxypeptidase, partial [Firmicutes bacterium]|nr:D-alanyl-D-alanine carboxypeptidase [Bacillota bacterium]
AAPKVKMGLETGEKISVEQLLYALLMQSSNDAAVALAVGTAGSVENFCAKMNEKAAEIGCVDTVFETPNGIDKGDHHSTPRDMALIAAYALDLPDFIRITNTKSIEFKTDKKTYSITNKNRFLSEYKGAIGVKTGFTGKAGHCFAGAAIRNGMTLVSVVFASGWGSAGKERKWTDTKALMNYGFENYRKMQLVNEGAIVRDIPVKNGKQAAVGTVIGENYTTAVKNGEKYTITLDLPKYLEAPVKKGSRAGTANIIINGKKEAEIPVIAADEVKGCGFWDYLRNVIEIWAETAV